MTTRVEQVAFTDCATSSHQAAPAVFVRMIWEWMSALAVGFARVNGARSVCSQNVLTLRYKHKVARITAPLVVADDVVQLGVTADGDTSWYRFNEPRIEQSVCSLVSPEPDCSIAVVRSSGPVPAASLPVNADLREDSTERFRVKVFNGEILLVSHACALLHRVRVWLEPRECVNAFAARSLYHVWEQP